MVLVLNVYTLEFTIASTSTSVNFGTLQKT